MRVPELFTVQGLLLWISLTSEQKPDGSYGPLRGTGYHGLCLGRRLYLAWRVFKGELDVLEWKDD